jgi:hypothetical protein
MEDMEDVEDQYQNNYPRMSYSWVINSFYTKEIDFVDLTLYQGKPQHEPT